MTVLVYTREKCPPCATLKYWLGKKGIAYKELDGADKPIVPTIVVGETVVTGLNFAVLNRLFGL